MLHMLPLSLVYLYACFSSKVLASNNNLARGFGDHISWISLDEALLEAKSKNQPIMLLVHKSWCGACKALKPKFSESQDIAELSKHFIMVNLEDDEEPKGEAYAPDGGYIPRILFLNPKGEVQTKYYNENGNSQYKYFYPDVESIITLMKKVNIEFSSSKPLSDEL